MYNSDAVRAFASTMTKPCACENNGEGTRAYRRKGVTDNTRVDNVEAARNCTYDCMPTSVHEGDVEAGRAIKGGSEDTCASVHAMIRLLVHTKG